MTCDASCNATPQSIREYVKPYNVKTYASTIGENGPYIK